MNIRIIALLMVLTVGICGCEQTTVDSGEQPSHGGQISIEATIENQSLKSEFCSGDSVGLYAANYKDDGTIEIYSAGNQADNAKYTYNNSTRRWTSESPAQYRDKKTAVDLICYYPHTEISSLTQQPLAVASDQSASYDTSVIMWGRERHIEPSSEPVTITLNPLTALIAITLNRGDGWTEEEWKVAKRSVTLCNTIREFKLNIATGAIRVSDNHEASNITPYCDGDRFIASLPPQILNATTRLFSIKLDDMHYVFTLDQRVEMESGKVYSYSITLDKRDTPDSSEKLTGTIIGTRYSVDYATSARSETVNTKESVFDSNYDTFFASYDRSNTWVGLDLGEPHVITGVGYSPRITQPSRVVTALIEGANNADFSDALPLYIIKEEAKEREMTYANVECSRGFRYVRYVTPNDKRCNLAELEFYGYPSSGDDSQLYQLTNLPTVVINTANAQEITSKEVEITSTVYIISQEGTHLLCDTDTGVRGRGNASWDFEKKPYRLKFSQKRSPLGAPAEAKKWTLLSNHGDKTLMRNILAFEVSRRLKMPYTPFCHPVDLIINGEYKGCYQLCDQIDVRENRVDITEMKSSDNSGYNLKGGYLIEVDAYAYNESVYFYSHRGTPVTIKSPDDDKITSEQRAYIERFYNDMEGAVFASNYTDPTNGYRKYLDLESFLRHFIIGEFAGNTDTYWSVYMYKDRSDDRLYVGPVWDYDLAFENDYRTYWINHLDDFLYASRGSTASESVRQMVDRIVKNDAAARSELQRIWQEAKLNGIEVGSLLEYVDETARLLEESQQLNFKRWPILNQWVHMNFQALGSYEAEVGTVKDYIRGRVDKLDWLIGHR
jgi:hypothetical protein